MKRHLGCEIGSSVTWSRVGALHVFDDYRIREEMKQSNVQD